MSLRRPLAVRREVTPRHAAQEMRQGLAAGESCGVLFGPERTGLLNDDVALADTVLTVPLNPGFASLNLAQAVMIVGYEWYTADVDPPPETLRRGGSRPATKEELLNFFDHLEEELERNGFLRNRESRLGMVATCAASSSARNAPSRSCAPCMAS